jgi:hypothetical protein
LVQGVEEGPSSVIEKPDNQVIELDKVIYSAFGLRNYFSLAVIRGLSWGYIEASGVQMGLQSQGMVYNRNSVGNLSYFYRNSEAV